MAEPEDALVAYAIADRDSGHSVLSAASNAARLVFWDAPKLIAAPSQFLPHQDWVESALRAAAADPDADGIALGYCLRNSPTAAYGFGVDEVSLAVCATRTVGPPTTVEILDGASTYFGPARGFYGFKLTGADAEKMMAPDLRAGLKALA